MLVLYRRRPRTDVVLLGTVCVPASLLRGTCAVQNKGGPERDDPDHVKRDAASVMGECDGLQERNVLGS